MEERGLKISRNNTEYLGTRRRDPFSWRDLKNVMTFMEDGELDADVNHRVQNGWNNW